jgi:hypothetical protein
MDVSGEAVDTVTRFLVRGIHSRILRVQNHSRIEHGEENQAEQDEDTAGHH